MKRAYIILAGLLVISGTALGYVMTGAWPYDSLAIYDQGGVPLKAGALHLSAAPTYWMADQLYDADGNVKDLAIIINEETGEVDPYYQSILALPIDVGYALTDRIQLDVTLQILAPEIETESGGLVSSTGVGDLWVKGRWLEPVGAGRLGGRLAVKAPVGKSKDLAADELPLGDGQIDVDVAAVGSFEPAASAFIGNGQIGYRYRFAKSEAVADPADPTETVDQDTQKGAIVYALLEPGLALGKEKSFRISVPILYETSAAVKVDGRTVADSETSGLAVGLSPKYALNDNHALGMKVFFPVMGKNVYKTFYLGFTYEGYLPL